MADATPDQAPASPPADAPPAAAPDLPAWLGPAAPARVTADVVAALAAGEDVSFLW